MERRTFVAGSVATAVAASMPRRLLAEDEKPEKHCRFGVNYTISTPLRRLARTICGFC
jgi:hypothetical protein